MITGPEAWLGREMERSTEWIRSLSPRAITELDAAIDGLKQRGLAWPHFGRSDFPLPTFSRDLSSVLHELEKGRGFVLLRGIPVDRYTEGELKSLYWGLGAHLGAARYQNGQGEEAGGEHKTFAMPVFAVHEGKLTTQYSRTFVEAAQKLPGVPRLSPAQEEALDLHAAVCEELAFTMELQPGDLQLLNNHVIYHSRTAYEDDDGPDRDRLLLRLWLAPSNSRALPLGFEVLWGTTARGAPRGGIAQPSRGEKGHG